MIRGEGVVSREAYARSEPVNDGHENNTSMNTSGSTSRPPRPSFPYGDRPAVVGRI